MSIVSVESVKNKKNKAELIVSKSTINLVCTAQEGRGKINAWKKVLFSLVVLLGGTSGWAADYKLDTAHAGVNFSVRHLMISNVKGRFAKFDGGFDYNEKTKTLSKVEIKIDVPSIDTNNKKRDEHLVSGDFFHVEKFPSMTFKADKVGGVEPGKSFKLPGVLTLRGVTNPVTLDAEFIGMTVGMGGESRVGFAGTTKIDRTSFGVNWNKALDRGGVAVGNTVEISIEGEAIRSDSVKK